MNLVFSGPSRGQFVFSGPSRGQFVSCGPQGQARASRDGRRLRLLAFLPVLAGLGAWVGSAWVGSALFGGIAHAQDPSAQLGALLKQGIDDYDNLNLDQAADRLRRATQLATKANVRTPVAAECWLRLGLVLIAQGKDGEGTQAFVEALKIQRKIQPDPAVMNPKATAAFEKAKALVPEEAPAPPAVPPPALPTPPLPPVSVSVDDVTHTPIARGEPGKPIEVSARVVGAKKGWAVAIRYNAGERFRRRRLAEVQAGAFAGEVPAQWVRAPKMEYFLVVLDENGKELLQVGASRGPDGQWRPFEVKVGAAAPPPVVSEPVPVPPPVSPPAVSPPDGDKRPLVSASDFLHVPPKSAERGRPVALSVTMSNRRRGISVAVRYEDQGRTQRQELMETMPGEFRGKIPGSAVRPKRLRYTLEVTGSEGEILAKLGRGGGAKEGDLEPWAVRVTEPDGPEEPEMPPDDRKKKPKPSEPRFLIAVGVGTGFGLVAGKSDSVFPGRNQPVDIKRGFATAPFHSGVEIG